MSRSLHRGCFSTCISIQDGEEAVSFQFFPFVLDDHPAKIEVGPHYILSSPFTCPPMTGTTIDQRTTINTQFSKTSINSLFSNSICKRSELVVYCCEMYNSALLPSPMSCLIGRFTALCAFFSLRQGRPTRLVNMACGKMPSASVRYSKGWSI